MTENPASGCDLCKLPLDELFSHLSVHYRF